MVLMLLSTLPPPVFPSGASPSPLSPCSNPFSASFAAVLRPVFNADSPDDIDMSATSTLTFDNYHLPSSTYTMEGKPSFTYPWLKPSPLRTTKAKALPPLPSNAGSKPRPASHTRHESEPVATTRPRPRERTLAASFGTASTRAARRSRYDSVPEVHISPSAQTPSTQSQPQQQPNRRDSSGHAHKLSMSIALSGVELDMSGSSFTPSGESSDSFSSSVSSIFDAPEPLRLGKGGSAQSSFSSVEEDDGVESMIVPLTIEVGGLTLGSGRLQPLEAIGAPSQPKWPKRNASTRGRQGSAVAMGKGGNGRRLESVSEAWFGD